MLFITLSGLGYATVSDNVTATFRLHSAKVDPKITNYWIIDYYGYGFDITLDEPDNKTLIFTDELLFPGWHLNLLIEITNDADVAVNLNYTIEYLNGSDWITTDKEGLLDLFRIIYEDGFYLDQDCNNPIPQNYTLGIGEVVYKKEYLYFDAQDYPELQDQEFVFHVIIEFTD